MTEEELKQSIKTWRKFTAFTFALFVMTAIGIAVA